MRLPHGRLLPIEELHASHAALAARSADLPLAFLAMAPPATTAFDFLFPELQDDPANLLPEGPATREALVALGRAMHDRLSVGGDSDIPAAYTYLGQFVDHDITLDVVSAQLPDLLAPALAPMSRDDVRRVMRNARTATLDLDSVYENAPVQGDGRLLIGTVSPTNRTEPPFLRPDGKDDANDLPRQPRRPGTTPEALQNDRAALIGDPRNDENTIVSQLHVAFLRTHNALVGAGHTFDEARRILRQHYQAIVLHDFLPRICDPAVVARTLAGSRLYDALREPFFLPLEFSVAAYRFGHSMVRATYDFNRNFNLTGAPGTVPSTLGLLFTFTALSGQLGDFDTLPENWIIEWERLVNVGDAPFRAARRIDPQLVEPLFTLPGLDGTSPQTEPARDGARLAVRNLLRGYLLRMPTGQAVVRAVNARLAPEHAIAPLTPDELEAAAADDAQREALRAGGFLERTPLWYYVLAEARARADGQHLGPLGSTLVAEVLVGLVRRSDDSILRTPDWAPTLPMEVPGTFRLPDLLRVAGVLVPADDPPSSTTPGVAAPTGQPFASRVLASRVFAPRATAAAPAAASLDAAPAPAGAALATTAAAAPPFDVIARLEVTDPTSVTAALLSTTAQPNGRDFRREGDQLVARITTNANGLLVWGADIRTAMSDVDWQLFLTRDGDEERETPDARGRTNGGGVADPAPRGVRFFTPATS